MWCVAELDEAYIATMEDVLKTDERPYDPKQPAGCFDEKAVSLNADVFRLPGGSGTEGQTR